MSSIINLINDKITENEPFYSLEFFPPRTEDGTVNLYSRIDRFAVQQCPPLFVDVTWSAGGATTKPKGPNPTPGIVRQVQEFCCLTTNMHLTCNVASKDQIREILKYAKNNNIRNILALRGDPPTLQTELSDDFVHGVDLVRFIRQEFGDYFCISVAGYPYGHPDCAIDTDNLLHLKEKVDAGADFIVSQLFFHAEDFLKWVQDCRAVGITCPILPGILPIQGYASLRNMTKMSGVGVPESIIKEVEPIKDDDAAIKEFGVKVATEMCQKLLAAGTPGLHFYTLNQEVVTLRILRNLNFWKKTVIREFPWKRPPGEKRRKEEVRPIYWSNRSKSYVARTEDWDDYPNGRWGDSSTPAFGDLTDYHIFLHQNRDKPEEKKKMWGNPVTVEDISSVFVSFLEGKIKELPWITTEISTETKRIKQDLLDLNKAGYWTINSQPAVNGAPSSDMEVGWGPSGGLVYQKAYLEFFCSPERITPLLKILEKYGKRFNYQFINLQGDYHTNLENAMAVTWGIFPGKQVVQPTIVDPVSFKVWKDEALCLWISKWASIYSDGSPSKELITKIYNSYYLVNIVDNNFIEKEIIFDILKEVINN